MFKCHFKLGLLLLFLYGIYIILVKRDIFLQADPLKFVWIHFWTSISYAPFSQNRMCRFSCAINFFVETNNRRVLIFTGVSSFLKRNSSIYASTGTPASGRDLATICTLPITSEVLNYPISIYNLCQFISLIYTIGLFYSSLS